VHRLTAQILVLPDGRKLAYITIGTGKPVVYFHGTASSRLEVLLLQKLADSGLQLIGVDRPGYGLSTYKPRKNLQDFNMDVNSLVDHLGFERFSVLGWSGGGVFALAYQTLNPQRVTRSVIVGAPSLPFDVSTAHDMPLARYIMKIPYAGEVAVRQLRCELLKAKGDPEAFLGTRQGKQLLHGCSKTDLAFFNNPEWIKLMYDSMAEAFHQGNAGVKAVVEEHQIFIKPWSLPFHVISEGRLHIWHGAEDKTCRVSNAYAIARLVPSAEPMIFGSAGHCVMFENLVKLGKIFES
jgi:pimeloyl-ACP methyl ester carboxylesterase